MVFVEAEFCLVISEWWPKCDVLCVALESLCVLLEYIISALVLYA